MDANSKEPVTKAWVKEFLIPIGSVLIAALALFAQPAQLPKWVIIFATGYLIIVATVSLYGPTVWLLSVLASKWRVRRSAKTYSKQLLESARKFRQLIASQNTNTLLYVFELAVFYDQQRGKPLLPDPEYILTVRDLLSSIEDRARRNKPGDFLALCKELSTLIHLYNGFCAQRLRKLEEFIAGRELTDPHLRELKQRWNVQRENHAAFIRDWETLAKRINQKAGSKSCIDYYETLGTLE